MEDIYAELRAFFGKHGCVDTTHDYILTILSSKGAQPVSSQTLADITGIGLQEVSLNCVSAVSQGELVVMRGKFSLPKEQRMPPSLLAQQIIDYLREHGPDTTKNIAILLELPHQVVASAAWRLARNDGLLVNNRGKYALAPDGTPPQTGGHPSRHSVSQAAKDKVYTYLVEHPQARLGDIALGTSISAATLARAIRELTITEHIVRLAPGKYVVQSQLTQAQKLQIQNRSAPRVRAPNLPVIPQGKLILGDLDVRTAWEPLIMEFINEARELHGEQWRDAMYLPIEEDIRYLDMRMIPPAPLIHYRTVCEDNWPRRRTYVTNFMTTVASLASDILGERVIYTQLPFKVYLLAGKELPQGLGNNEMREGVAAILKKRRAAYALRST